MKRVVAIVVSPNMTFVDFNRVANDVKRTDADQIVIASVSPRDVSTEGDAPMWLRAALSREPARTIQVTGANDPVLPTIAETIIA